MLKVTRFITFVFLFLTTILPIYGEEPEETPVAITYTVTWNSNGGSEIMDSEYVAGDVIDRPINPTKNGYLFNGWYTSYSLEEEWYFTRPIHNDMDLYAKWVQVKEDTVDGFIVESSETVTTQNNEQITFVDPNKGKNFNITFLDSDNEVISIVNLKYGYEIHIYDNEDNIVQEYITRKDTIINLDYKDIDSFIFDGWIESFDDNKDIFSIVPTYKEIKEEVSINDKKSNSFFDNIVNDQYIIIYSSVGVVLIVTVSVIYYLKKKGKNHERNKHSNKDK